MSQLPIMYTNIIALDREIHRDKRLAQPDRPYAFAAHTNFIPAIAAEFTLACRDMPIIFVDDGKEVSPIFAVGLRTGTNLFVNEDGQWAGYHIPAYLRRYPFIGGDTGDSQIICVDDGAPNLRNFSGERLFDEGGEPSELLRRAMAFVADYTAAAKATGEMTKRLKELDLFMSTNIDVRPEGQEPTTLQGFSIISEERLMALSDADTLDLRRRGYLGPIYAHLISLANFAQLGSKTTNRAKVPDLVEA